MITSNKEKVITNSLNVNLLNEKKKLVLGRLFVVVVWGEYDEQAQSEITLREGHTVT